MTMYEKNVQALKKHQPELYRYMYGELKEESGYDYEVRFARTQKGEIYPKVRYQGEWWLLNSQHDPVLAAKLYIDGHREEIVDYGIYYIFGISDGTVIRQLMTAGNNTNLWIIHEPNGDYFDLLMKEMDLTDLIYNERVYLSAESRYVLQRGIEGVVDYNNQRLVHHLILPNYDRVYNRECESSIEMIVYEMKNSIIRKNTIIDFQKEYAQNSLVLMRDILYQSNLFQMKEYFKTQNIKDVPVIIVAAGPSLNKNIETLKLAEGKAFIIVVDAALRAVYDHHVHVDMAISVDSRVPDRFFEGIDISEIPFVFEPISRSEIIDRHRGRRFYDGMPNRYFQNIAEELTTGKYAAMKTGGSVSTVVFSLAIYLGFRVIVFVGQDLAFTGGQTYNQSLKFSKTEDEIYQKERYNVLVKGQDGSMLETDYQMDMYRQWIENSIKMLPKGIRVIDATEGGALIEGTEIMTLQQAIEECCHTQVDFKSMLADVPDAFSSEQRQEIIARFRDEPNRLKQLIEQIKVGEKNIKNLLECYHENDIAEQKKLILELDEINTKIREYPMQDIILFYNSDTEYSVGGDVFADDIEIPKLCEKALAWYKGCISAIEQLSADLQRLFLDVV
ncbi:MAG: motility associated factor glycosyltransferase family protein [Lachnospiraceae bacterium]|nr:motility associated factor glycosyltransferase family protein [Lachnospiraceae bacterium]